MYELRKFFEAWQIFKDKEIVQMHKNNFQFSKKLQKLNKAFKSELELWNFKKAFKAFDGCTRMRIIAQIS